MVPETFPIEMEDIYKEVYWVDEFIGETPAPPETPGTTFKHEDALVEPYPMVDVFGHTSQQRNYYNDNTTLRCLVVDSNFGLISAPKSKFLGYEHRVPIMLFQAVYGYSTWNEVKAVATDALILANAIKAFRNRPADDADRELYGNAFLETSTYKDAVTGGNNITGVKWAWLRQGSKANIPCGRDIFRYRTIVDGEVSEAVDQFADAISATFTSYYIDSYGQVYPSTVTLYYHPSEDKWKTSGGGLVTGAYHQADFLQGSFDEEDLQNNFVYQIFEGDLTAVKIYLPITRNVFLLGETGNWVQATKMVRYGDEGLFDGVGYKIDSTLVTGKYLEAEYYNNEYRHESGIKYSQWGDNYQFKNFSSGTKGSNASVTRDIPFVPFRG